jgi:hypothetical protein
LSGGFLYTVQPGTTVQFGIAPSYPQVTYTDSSGIVSNNNPITLDSSGEADVWLTGYTKLVLFDKDGNLVWSKDNVSSQAQIQPSTLQWVPQTSQATYVGPVAGQPSQAQFSVLGNQTAVYLSGTSVMASITGTNIIGVVQSSSYSSTTNLTTVTASWYSTLLNASLSAVYTGVVAGGAPGSLPVLPTIPVSANKTANSVDLFQTIMVSNAAAITLPAANSVPDGSWYDIFNTGASNAVVTPSAGTINSAANLVLTQNTGRRIFSANGTWYAR